MIARALRSGSDHRRTGWRGRLGAATIVAALAIAPLAAQLPPWSEAMGKAQESAAAGRYLEASELLLTPDGTPLNPSTDQLWRQITPFMTNELPLDPAGGAAGDAEWTARITAAQPRDAIAEIVRRARQTRIVILNEAHYSPRDRAFALEVARALRPLGYTYLAAETFANAGDGTTESPEMARLRQDRFVRRDTGFYTLDPVFAGFVRHALALGYTPVAYEATREQTATQGDIAERDRHQAENLMARVFRVDPTAKALIYVGHGHVRERRADAKGAPLLAENLARLSGVDPLTIEQTTVTDLTRAAKGAYAAASARITRPAVFFAGKQPLILSPSGDSVDLQVVHPRRSYRFGRPAWLGTLGGRPLAIPARYVPTTGCRLVQAFAADAPPDAVPLDQVLVTAGEPAPTLMVPTTRVRFAVQDSANPAHPLCVARRPATG